MNHTDIYSDIEREAMDAATSEFMQAVGVLVRRVRASSKAQEISLTQSSILSRLDREGPATVSDLARAENMKPQSMGASVAALEEMGMIERTPHATDGRQMNIALTPRGLEVRQSIRKAKITWLAQAISQLDPEERATLLAAGKILKRLGEM